MARDNINDKRGMERVLADR